MLFINSIKLKLVSSYSINYIRELMTHNNLQIVQNDWILYSVNYYSLIVMNEGSKAGSEYFF